jgi:ABC-2 type transport system ATP-binding protein
MEDMKKKEVVLKVNKLTKVFPGGFSLRKMKRSEPTVAVDNITFDINEGEIVGLLGPNGAGKTTTIQMLLSTTERSSGQIRYFGRDFRKYRSEVLQKINYASAYTKLPWRMTVYENLMVYAKMYEVDKPKERIDMLLEQFEMSEYKYKTIVSLSAGQSTRIILVKAFINFPQLLLLDEPTASLDPDIAVHVRKFLIKQQQKYKVAMLFTSHNMAEVSEICDRVIFLRKGKIVAEDTPEGLAKTIKISTLHLKVGDGLKRLQAFAKARGYEVNVEGRDAMVVLEEKEIAAFLHKLASHRIQYSEISIDKPTLEDYFITQTRSKHE